MLTTDIFTDTYPVIRSIVIVLIAYFILSLILLMIKRRLLKKTRSKKLRSNIKIFSRILYYASILILGIFAIFSYIGSWTGLGISVGLLSAALGWALQKPITGIAGWIMIILKRPFEIGDRIILGNVKGDVVDISLTHVSIAEVGGIIGGEENSGRITLVPNSKLFEQNIVNYTGQDTFILSQVVVPITFESDLEKAIKIGQDSAKEITKGLNILNKNKKVYIQTFFQANGINVHIKFFAPAKEVQEYTSRVTKETFKEISKQKDITLAYPHTEVILNKKKR